MGKVQNNESGFSAVEVILVLVIVVLIGAVGYLVYKNHHKTTLTPVASTTTTNEPATTTPAKTATPAPNSYAGWQSYTLKHEKLSFKYPSTWTLSDTSTSDGEDMVELTGPNGFYFDLDTSNVGHPSLEFPTTVVSSVSVTFAGQKGYVNYFKNSSNGSDTIIGAELSSNPSTVFDNVFPTKNMSPRGNFTISLGYKDNTTTITSSTIKTDPNLQDVGLLLNSTSY